MNVKRYNPVIKIKNKPNDVKNSPKKLYSEEVTLVQILMKFFVPSKGDCQTYFLSDVEIIGRRDDHEQKLEKIITGCKILTAS